MSFLGKTLLAFDLLCFVLQSPICLLLQVSIAFLLCIPVPYNEKDIFWGVLILDGLADLHITIQLLQHDCQGIDLDYCDIEWFALEMNRDHSVIFESASRYCTLDSFVDYDGYSIPSKGFLPTVVDIMVR